MIDLTFMEILFSEHEQKHMHWMGVLLWMFWVFFFNCILFIAFKIIVTEKLAEYCPVIPVFYSNKCYVWSVLKMAQLILKILSPKIYLQPKLRHIIVFSIR